MDDKPLDVLIHYPMSEEQVETLRALSDRLRFTLYSVEDFTRIPLEAKSQAEVLLTSETLSIPEEMPHLCWIQFARAGIGFIQGSPLLERKGFVATSLSGAIAPKVAEYALMAMLALGHRLPDIMGFQGKKLWPPDRWNRFRPLELRSNTVGLVGYGSIAREIARLLLPFEVDILATKRDLMALEDDGYTPAGTGDPEGVLFKRLYPVEALKSMLKLCDFVVVCLPLTENTQGVIGAPELAAMKDGACLVALGRGGQVDEGALVKALRAGKLAGAVLDVFAQEPLPPESPLWEAPNLVITPHIAGNTFRYAQLVLDLFSENLTRYLKGEPLFNVFDPHKGC